MIAARRRDGPAFLAQGDKSTLAPRCCIEERFARIGPIDVEIGHAVRIGHIVEAIEFERRLALDMDDEIVALAHHLEILGTLAGLQQKFQRGAPAFSNERRIRTNAHAFENLRRAANVRFRKPL